MRPFFTLFVLSLLLIVIMTACGSGSDAQTATVQLTSVNPTATVEIVPTPTATPIPAFPGFEVVLSEGLYWDFRWQHEEVSCAQGRDCTTQIDSGVFRVQLGQAERIDSVVMYPMIISGRNLAGEDQIDLAPRWPYVGFVDGKLVVSEEEVITTIFDAATGEWTGGGFFGRFHAIDEDHVAVDSSITPQDSFAEWLGVETGPAISVIRSDSQSMCELVDGRRICPNDQTFSVDERQIYRDGVGPFGYTYRLSASFSGGGFFSSNTLTESVALVSGTALGDELTYDFESEPNDGFEQSDERRSVPYSVIGRAHLLDTYEILSLTEDLAFPGHDFFDIDTSEVESVTVTLTALTNTDSTIGFLVTSFDGESLAVESISLEETVTQSVQFDVVEGKFYTVVVGAVISPTGPTDYILTVE